MREISGSCLERVSGAAELVFDVEQRYSIRHERNESNITIQFDGSMPPELQARIDSGESYSSMRGTLIAYNLIINNLKAIHPELFTG